jgi:pilus assembly protein CpaE
MGLNANILAIVTQDPATAQAIRATFKDEANRFEWRQFDRLDAFSRSTDIERVTAAIFDIDANPEAMLHELETLSHRLNTTRFIVLASELKNDLLLKAMQAGARHFVVKARMEAELASAIDRLAVRTNVSHGVGALITVLSVGGGCGSTTVSVNLAQELADLEHSPAVIVDLDVRYGGAAGLLGAKAQYGIADVLAAKDRIDSTLVRSSSVVISEGLSLLASPGTVDFAHPKRINEDNYRVACKAMCEAYDFVVVDASRVTLNGAITLARESVQTLLVFELNVEQLRRARHMAHALNAIPEVAPKLLPVVNRFRSRRACASVEEARKALNTQAIRTITNDYAAVTACVNEGRPLAVSSPRSRLRKDIRGLAESIHATAFKRNRSNAA